MSTDLSTARDGRAQHLPPRLKRLYFYGGSTRPEFRGKGAYRGLVAHRLKLLAARAIPRAFVLARKATSAPICRKLGFKVACECRSYDFSF